MNPNVSKQADIKLGLTLYSLTAEWAAGLYDLPGLLKAVHDYRLGPGIEMNGAQMLRTYPHVTPEFVDFWHESMEKYDFEPSSFGTNLDMGRRADRDMTLDEEFEFTRAQLESAHALGYKLARIQNTKPALLERLLPLAEKLDITMGYEIHAPKGPNTPDIIKIRELYEKLDSPRLGFVADFSATMHSMAPTLLRTMRRMGLDDAAIEKLQEIWKASSNMHQQAEEFFAYLRGRGLDPATLGPFGRLAFNMQGHVPIADWADIMPQIVHVHAKFYDIDEHGNEPAIDYPGLVRVFAENGYRGYFSTEWEGHAFADLGEAEPLKLVRAQHDLILKTLKSLNLD